MRRCLMKRTELRRRTPLRSVTPLVQGAPLQRRTPLAPVSAKRQQQNRRRVIRETELGRHGLNGVCARCGVYTYVNGHERRNRSQGGDPARPDCLLCVACNGWVADHPRQACFDGWSISPKWPHDHALENGEARDLDGCIVVFGTETAA